MFNDASSEFSNQAIVKNYYNRKGLEKKKRESMNGAPLHCCRHFCSGYRRSDSVRVSHRSETKEENHRQQSGRDTQAYPKEKKNCRKCPGDPVKRGHNV